MKFGSIFRWGLNHTEPGKRLDSTSHERFIIFQGTYEKHVSHSKRDSHPLDNPVGNGNAPLKKNKHVGLK